MAAPISQKQVSEAEEPEAKRRCSTREFRYTADVLLTEENDKRMQELWNKVQNSLPNYNFNSKEARVIRQCIRSMSDAPDDRYRSSIEIKDVVFQIGQRVIIEKGVFAARHFNKGEVVGNYGGELRPLSEIEGPNKLDYLFEFPETPFSEWGIDGREAGNFTRYINHTSIDQENVTAVEFFYGGVPRVVFITTKPIPVGAEMKYNYGDVYWIQKGITPVESIPLELFNAVKAQKQGAFGSQRVRPELSASISAVPKGQSPSAGKASKRDKASTVRKKKARSIASTESERNYYTILRRTASREKCL